MIRPKGNVCGMGEREGMQEGGKAAFAVITQGMQIKMSCYESLPKFYNKRKFQKKWLKLPTSCCQ